LQQQFAALVPVIAEDKHMIEVTVGELAGSSGITNGFDGKNHRFGGRIGCTKT